FQAEDGIRDRNVTGVQTCALPIYFKITVKGAVNVKPLKLAHMLFLVLILGLAGCGSAKDDGDVSNGGDGDDAENSGERITIGTGGTSGTYYPLGVDMAQQIFSDVDGVASANAVSTGASVANAQERGDGDYQLALIQNDIAYYAVNGETLEDFEGNTVDNMAGMVSLRSEEHTSELQSRFDLVCRLLLEKKKQNRCMCSRYHKTRRTRQ